MWGQTVVIKGILIRGVPMRGWLYQYTDFWSAYNHQNTYRLLILILRPMLPQGPDRFQKHKQQQYTTHTIHNDLDDLEKIEDSHKYMPYGHLHHSKYPYLRD